MVPGSTLMYGSNFWMATDRPRATSSWPMEAAAIPLPSEDTTPPVTKMKRVGGRFGILTGKITVPRDAGGIRNHAAASNSSACLRAPSSSESAPSMRHSSSTTAGPGSCSTLARGHLALRALLDPEVAVGHRGDLRQVGDAEHLALGAQRAQPLPDRAGGLAAHPGVDLVEHQRPRRARARGGHERQHHARQLAAGRGLAQRRRGHARVGRQQEVDPLRPRRAHLLARLQHDLERRAVHRERVELLDHAPGQLRRRLRPRLGELRRPARARSASASAAAADRPLGGHLGVGQPVALGAAALGVLEHRGHRAAVLALEPVVAVQALLDLVQPLGVRVQPLEVAAQLDAEVLGLDPQRPQPLGQRVHGRVGAGHAVGQALGLGQQRGRAGGVGVVGRDGLRARRRGGAQAVDLAQPAALGHRAPRDPPRLGSSASISSISKASRSRSRSRVPARSRSSSSSRAASRTRACAAATRSRSSRCARPQKASSSSSWADGDRQAAVLVLAEEGQQPAAQRLQVRRGGRAALDVGAAAALGADPARQHHLAVVLRRAARAGPRAPGRPAARRAGRRRPRRRPRARPGARSPRAACRPAAGPARAPAPSCPRRSRP